MKSRIVEKIYDKIQKNKSFEMFWENLEELTDKELECIRKEENECFLGEMIYNKNIKKKDFYVGEKQQMHHKWLGVKDHVYKAYLLTEKEMKQIISDVIDETMSFSANCCGENNEM